MKRAVIHNPYWDSLGGGERYCSAFARLLLDEGWAVDILWPEDMSQAIWKRFQIDLKGAQFVSAKKMNQYDLVFWVSDGSVPTLFPTKTILHFQVPFHDAKSGSWLNKIKARFYTCVCNSFFTKSFIDKTYAINSIVIHPAVNTQKFSPTHKKNQIVSLARFSRRLHSKRQDTLIQAFAKLKLPDWKLILAGGADDNQYLRQLRSQARRMEVDFIVNPPSEDVIRLLDESKIFWSATGFGVDQTKFPEKMEHFGITPVEAMAAGCVPIVTSKGGHLETVAPDQTGYLFNTLDELVDYTKKLANDKNKLETMSRNSVSRSKNFSTEVFNQKFKQLL